jgi:hypothetical protein
MKLRLIHKSSGALVVTALMAARMFSASAEDFGVVANGVSISPSLPKTAINAAAMQLTAGSAN